MAAPRYAYEDFRPGDRAEYGGLIVERDEMLAFAREFDPQPMHLSEEAARASMLGELIASGWQTAALAMRMHCDQWLADSTSLGSPGVDSLEWLRPVKAGDRLSVLSEVLAARVSASRPDRGIVTFRFEVVNQHGDIVLRQVGPILFGRRNAEAA
ncbi:MaoC family dehydratase [Methylopila musalis]|uniref:MaoC family dehydratase n=1 Tax=Methylopila musalis TaxID=1134781 RepID=A0ABW3Z587_9HYPH